MHSPDAENTKLLVGFYMPDSVFMRVRVASQWHGMPESSLESWGCLSLGWWECCYSILGVQEETRAP